jgi:hypothetical protein
VDVFGLGLAWLRLDFAWAWAWAWFVACGFGGYHENGGKRIDHISKNGKSITCESINLSTCVNTSPSQSANT